jgi:hypothetical protein
MLTFTLKKRWHDPDPPPPRRYSWYTAPDTTQRRDLALKVTCERFHCTPQQIHDSTTRGGKFQRLTSARLCLCWILNRKLGISEPRVGRFLHKDHSTVHNGVKRAAERPAIMDIIVQLLDEMRRGDANMPTNQ